MKKIAEIIPYLFEDHLLISLDKEWIIKYGYPKFEDLIDNEGNLLLKTLRPTCSRRKKK